MTKLNALIDAWYFRPFIIVSTSVQKFVKIIGIYYFRHNRGNKLTKNEFLYFIIYLKNPNYFKIFSQMVHLHHLLLPLRTSLVSPMGNLLFVASNILGIICNSTSTVRQYLLYIGNKITVRRY